MAPTLKTRLVRAADSETICDILAEVFDEYGMTFDPEGFDRDVADPIAHYPGPDAAFWVIETERGVVGCVGVHAEAEHSVLHRLYISPSVRGRGVGSLLCDQAESWSLARGLARMELWSDVRFTDAHRLYWKRGYQIFSSRVLADPDRSVEFGMERDLRCSGAARSRLASGLLSSSREAPTDALSAGVDPDLAHKARMALAGILDCRTLNRVSARSHALPPVPPRYQARVAGPATTLTVIGFETPRGFLPHPSCL
jgi:putative acetyltransferase